MGPSEPQQLFPDWVERGVADLVAQFCYSGYDGDLPHLSGLQIGVL